VQNLTEAIGWASSLILLLTIAKQIHTQWASGETKGVSRWLFIGQMAASIGFAIYSYLVNNPVFVCTNSLMVVNGLVGYIVLRRNRRRRPAAE
jgi:MtN3 and saliva related transmembrane protein